MDKTTVKMRQNHWWRNVINSSAEIEVTYKCNSFVIETIIHSG